MKFAVKDLHPEDGPVKPTKPGGRVRLRFVVEAIEGTQRKSIHQTLTADPLEANRLAVQIAACDFCQAQYLRGVCGPPHDNASPRCESGKRPHCTCSICF